jgi:hypothetical protein
MGGTVPSTSTIEAGSASAAHDVDSATSVASGGAVEVGSEVGPDATRIAGLAGARAHAAAVTTNATSPAPA